MKRSIATCVLIVVVTITGLAVLTARPTTARAGATDSHVIRTGAILTNTLLGSSTQVDQVDMLSPTLGYALATRYLGRSRYRYYLVRTTNLARSWTVRSEIPSNDERYPIFTDFDTVDSDPMIDFVNRNVGYVLGPDDSIYVTNNGGLTWEIVEPNDSNSSYGISGSTMTAVTTKCHTPSASSTPECSSELTGYEVGSTVPEYSRMIPNSNLKYQNAVSLLAAAPDSTQIVNLSTDGWTTRSSLIVTHDDGRTWTRLLNPCSGSLIEQLIVANNGRWLLTCFLDHGSYHGTANIFRSTDDGVRWTTVLDDTAQRNIVGDLGGTPAYFFLSGNDRVLYAALMGPAGGLAVSYDGGTHWGGDSALGNTGGSPGSLSVFGPTSSIYQVWQGPTYVTSNIRTWHLLPPLPAGPYKGLSICTSKHTLVSLRRVKAGGLRYTYVDFTNDGSTSCYLDGAPNLQPLGVSSAPIGLPVGSELVTSDGDFAILKPFGGIANLSLFINPASSYKPTSTCRAEKASALRLSFGFPAKFVLSLGSHPIFTCTKVPSVFLNGLKTGPGKP
ncbi:MAG: DUF4232 domain-containing protein [Acidimicrobiales bacterium]|jgi:photosystem II stability/assembly factor-like uncharacterized protein